MRAVATALAVLGLALPAHAGVKAKFLDGAYVFTDDGCAKLKSLAAGGNQNVGTYPWYVTRDGISYWEGGCEFTKIRPGKKNQWKVTASCGEEDGESTETYTYLKTSSVTFAVTLTTPGASADDRKPVTYTRCDVDEAKLP
jgi:hypothetical protein